MKIPFFLVTGFLGSGKTTLLKRFLNRYAGSKKIGIIQNEFAPANIDSVELKSGGDDFEILEINNGSVFCVCLLGDFIKSLNAFIDRKSPDVILLESSGLSDPVAIAELLQLGELKDKTYLCYIWCVVDALNFDKHDKMGTRIHHQIRVADTVIINKTDLVNTNTENIRTRIHAMNPYAEIVQGPFCEVDFDHVFRPVRMAPVAMIRAGEDINFESCGRPDIQVCVVKTTEKIALETLTSFISKYAAKTYRIKGYAFADDGKAYALQTTGTSTSISPVDYYDRQSVIILMGDQLPMGEIRGDLKIR